jgi:hypothetical protein
MPENKAIVPVGKIEQRILLIRGEKVIVDADLAEFYGVPTKRLNEQVKRNKDRFPDDFMFQLSAKEKSEVKKGTPFTFAVLNNCSFGTSIFIPLTIGTFGIFDCLRLVL